MQPPISTASDSDECHLEAYDTAGGLLCTSIFFQPSGHPGGGGMMAVVGASPIADVKFYEVGSFAGAVYWDNVEFTAAVPEHGTYAMLGLGLAAIGAVARRRRSA